MDHPLSAHSNYANLMLIITSSHFLILALLTSATGQLGVSDDHLIISDCDRETRTPFVEYNYWTLPHLGFRSLGRARLFARVLSADDTFSKNVNVFYPSPELLND